MTDAASVAAFVARLPAAVHLLVNNAGGALGLDRIEDARDEDWIGMWETNVLGVMRLTRALLPALKASGDGHVINLGSIAGFETYLGGAGYTGAKHAVRALTRTLRLELLGAAGAGDRGRSRGSSRPSSRWSASPATRSGRRRSTAGSSR